MAKLPLSLRPKYVTNFEDEILLRRGDVRALTDNHHKASGIRPGRRMRVVVNPNCDLFYFAIRHTCFPYLLRPRLRTQPYRSSVIHARGKINAVPRDTLLHLRHQTVSGPVECNFREIF